MSGWNAGSIQIGKRALTIFHNPGPYYVKPRMWQFIPGKVNRRGDAGPGVGGSWLGKAYGPWRAQMVGLNL